MIKRLQNSRGFTLIELLIVIVIIGILAGVLIAIINPAQQQNRARDANVKATMNKVVLATQGYVSAYGAPPDEVQFMSSFQNATKFGVLCDTVGGYDCVFSVTGNALPITGCSVGNWKGADGSVGACYFRYYRDNAGWSGIDATRFRIYARAFGLANTVFMFDTNVGAIQHCNATTVSDADVTSCVTP